MKQKQQSNFSINAPITLRTKKGKRVGFIKLFNYILQLTFLDKAFLIIFALAIMVGIVFAILAKVTVLKIVMFNWYYLINGVFLLILSARLVTYFLHTKFEDQTMTIIIQQRTKRIVVLISIWCAIFIAVLLMNVMNTAILLVFNNDNYSLRYLVVNLIYQTVASVFLISFLCLITMLFKQQIVSIILSFILLSFFISSLPQQFFDQKMDSTTITLRTEEGQTVKYTAGEINHSFTFNENVEQGHIKFPYLSQYINDSFIEQQFTIRNFEDTSSLSPRLAIWQDLGIVDNTPFALTSNNSETFALQIANINTRVNLPAEFVNDDVVLVNLNFNSKFKNISQIQSLLEAEQDPATKAVLQDLVDYYAYYSAMFKASVADIDSEVDFINELWKAKFNNYGAYLKLQLDNTTSYITKLIPPTEEETDGESIQYNISNTLFSTYILNNYYLPDGSKNTDLMFKMDDQNNVYAQNYQALITTFSQQMFMELFIRNLEENFINQVSNYVTITHSVVVKDSNYAQYVDYVDNYQWLNHVLFTANLNSYFLTYAGSAYDQYWFDFSSKSYIDFTTQDNVFLSKTKFKFVEADGALTKMVKPNIQFFLYIQIIFWVITTSWSTYIFIRKDLK